MQGNGHGDEERRAGHRHQRLGRSAHSGRCQQSVGLHRDFPAQYPRLGRDPADFGHFRSVRGRRGLLARPDRLHSDESGNELHVRDRTESRQDRHRRGSESGAARRRVGPCGQERRSPFRLRKRRGGHRHAAQAARLPAVEQHGGRSRSGLHRCDRPAGRCAQRHHSGQSEQAL